MVSDTLDLYIIVYFEPWYVTHIVLFCCLGGVRSVFNHKVDYWNLWCFDMLYNFIPSVWKSHKQYPFMPFLKEVVFGKYAYLLSCTQTINPFMKPSVMKTQQGDN